jgi:ATP-dependent Zn protease
LELDNKSQTGVDFLTAKESILKELDLLTDEDRGGVSFPEIYPEKSEIKVDFSLPTISKDQILDGIQILKNHLENLRIHTFEPGYYCIQAMNDNLFETKNMLDNIRFRFIASRSISKIEISKKGNFRTEEIFAITSLYKYLLGGNGKRTQNPKELLAKLGISVFDPIEEALKGNTMDFDFIAGYEEVKREIMDSIIRPVLSPNTFDEVSRLTRKFPSKNRPRAILFEGDPGVGKTTMAKIVACKCEIPLIYVPIESILSKYYGESSQNLAYVFDAASLFPSSILFLDEIDSLAGSREEGIFEATRKLLSVLLRKLDGFEGKPRTITLGATNRKQDLDRALLSRFDKSIYFPLPNPNERAAILGNYAMHLSEKERIGISIHLEGLSGRNLKDFCDYVERKWASHLIEIGEVASAPPIRFYEETSIIFRKPY